MNFYIGSNVRTFLIFKHVHEFYSMGYLEHFVRLSRELLDLSKQLIHGGENESWRYNYDMPNLILGWLGLEVDGYHGSPVLTARLVVSVINNFYVILTLDWTLHWKCNLGNLHFWKQNRSELEFFHTFIGRFLTRNFFFINGGSSEPWLGSPLLIARGHNASASRPSRLLTEGNWFKNWGRFFNDLGSPSSSSLLTPLI